MMVRRHTRSNPHCSPTRGEDEVDEKAAMVWRPRGLRRTAGTRIRSGAGDGGAFRPRRASASSAAKPAALSSANR
ncbi:hypothetical protein TYRP_022341 [Tyrophagus putrescentiae]|nr:hypothetical protein TYRP_022341 [Tyrophagus putrescentiae]